VFMKNLLHRLLAARTQNRDAFKRGTRSLLLVPLGTTVFVLLATPSATVVSPLLWMFVLLPLLGMLLIGMSLIAYCGVLMKRVSI
jgi:hypothetical protein